jgi:hypothetical protein
MDIPELQQREDCGYLSAYDFSSSYQQRSYADLCRSSRCAF